MKDIKYVYELIEELKVEVKDWDRRNAHQDATFEIRKLIELAWFVSIFIFLVTISSRWLSLQLQKLSYISSKRVSIIGVDRPQRVPIISEDGPQRVPIISEDGPQRVPIISEDGPQREIDYELSSLISSTNDSNIYEGFYQENMRAIKRLSHKHDNLAENERKILLKLCHSNIVRCYGCVPDKSFTYIILELCDFDLNDLVVGLSHAELSNLPISKGISYVLSKLKGKCCLWEADGHPSVELIKLIRKIMDGLQYLHLNKIIHRDLNPTNVLIKASNKGIIPKLAGMGISKVLEGESSVCPSDTDYRTSGWMAPELLSHDEHSFSADMFSLGCLIFFCITEGRHPFGDDIDERKTNIRNGKVDTFLIQEMAEAYDLVTKLLMHSPQERLNIEEALRHPFLWEVDKRMRFVALVSDTINVEGPNSSLEKLVESVASQVIKSNWKNQIHPAILSHMQKNRPIYRGQSLSSLLRLMRNSSSHFTELAKFVALQNIIPQRPSYFSEASSSQLQNNITSPKPDDLYQHLFKQFDNLFMQIYNVVRDNHPYNISDEFTIFMK